MRRGASRWEAWPSPDGNVDDPSRIETDRRGFMRLSTCGLLGLGLTRVGHGSRSSDMYGLIGKIIAVDRKRDELASVLLDGTRDIPGCRSYVVAKDTEDPNALWVTEVWDSEEAHQHSLTLPSVQEAIQNGRPLIADFAGRYETVPIGGHGLEP